MVEKQYDLVRVPEGSALVDADPPAAQTAPATMAPGHYLVLSPLSDGDQPPRGKVTAFGPLAQPELVEFLLTSAVALGLVSDRRGRNGEPRAALLIPYRRRAGDRSPRTSAPALPRAPRSPSPNGTCSALQPRNGADDWEKRSGIRQ